jgi:hypothetical protein
MKPIVGVRSKENGNFYRFGSIVAEPVPDGAVPVEEHHARPNVEEESKKN